MKLLMDINLKNGNKTELYFYESEKQDRLEEKITEVSKTLSNVNETSLLKGVYECILLHHSEIASIKFKIITE